MLRNSWPKVVVVCVVALGLLAVLLLVDDVAAEGSSTFDVASPVQAQSNITLTSACSGPCRPSIPMDAVHSFRGMPTTCSNGMSTTFPSSSESVDGIVRIQWTT